ncbi:MAG TPA: acyltransferase [Gemmatimonadales bacterium]|jgi:acetyltransferase-like isoleucine patch superfamily enzyme|nr:acyltransferase [Gemmatimonadales bacterium]
MVLRPLRQVSLPQATQASNDAWLAELDAALGAPQADWARICRDTLFGLWYPGAPGCDALLEDRKTPAATRAVLLALDPHNITLEPEYYAEVDAEKFARVKPLLWLWYSFDRTPAGAQNVELGVKFRRLLAPRIFARCGKNFKCFQHTEFSFGYNLEVGDDCVVHRHVLLDDRGGIVMGDRVSVADYANIYSHTHSIVDQKDVTDARTVLEDDVRITYHATVLAGVRVGRNGMVGANAVATKDVRPYHVYVGIPAKSIRVKPNAPPEAYVTERVAKREN